MKKMACVVISLFLLFQTFCFAENYSSHMKGSSVLSDSDTCAYRFNPYGDSDEYLYSLDDADRSRFVVSERLCDIFGQPDLKEEAIEIIDMIKNAHIYRGLGADIPNLITIRGMKKTGRTLMARAIAGEVGAYFVSIDSVPAIGVCQQLLKRSPVVIFSNEGSSFSTSDAREFIEKHGFSGKRAGSQGYNEIIFIRTKDSFGDYDLDDGYSEKEDAFRIVERTIYVPELDQEARFGLLKKFAKDFLVKPGLFDDDTFLNLSFKTGNFSAIDLKEMVNRAALLAGRDYSLCGGCDYEIDKKHFFEAYYEMSKDVQTGNMFGIGLPFSFTYAEETRFSDVLGVDRILGEIREYIDILLHKEKYKKIGIDSPKGLLLEGLSGVGKTLIARAIAGEAGCCFFSISASQFSSGFMGGGVELVSALFRIANAISPNRPKIIFIDEFDSMGKRSEVSGGLAGEQRNVINEFLKQMDGFEQNENILVIAATNDAEMLDPSILREGRFDRRIYIPLPDEQGRKEILQHYMDRVFCDEKMDKDCFARVLAKKCKGFSGAGLKTLVNEAAILAIRGDSSFVAEEHFLHSYERIAPQVQKGMGGDNEEGFQYTFSEDTTFENVIGMPEVVEEVKKFIDVLTNPGRYKEIGVGRQKGMIFSGPPGTGKTLLARAIAGAANCCFIQANPSWFAKIYVGAGPSRVRKLFYFARKMARNGHKVIIFFEEMDGFGKRSADSGSGGCSERNNILNELLSQIDGFSQDENIVVLGATNNINLIDEALLRDGRFDKKIEIPYPSLRARTEILEYYLKNIKLDPTLSISLVAHRYAKDMKGKSGASLEALVKKAALNAVHSDAEFVTSEHLEEAFLSTLLGLRSSEEQSQEEFEMTACHEAGHALMSVLTGNEVTRLSIFARTKALGVMFGENKYEVFCNNSRSDLLYRLMVLLAGFCAESLIYGQTTPGAHGDLREANELAFEMVHNYGMDDGKLRGIVSSRLIADSTKEKFDQASINILHNCLHAADHLLRTNQDKLDALRSALLEREDLSGKEIYEIVGQPNNVARSWLR